MKLLFAGVLLVAVVVVLIMGNDPTRHQDGGSTSTIPVAPEYTAGSLAEGAGDREDRPAEAREAVPSGESHEAASGSAEEASQDADSEPSGARSTLTDTEVFALEQSFEALHLDSTRQQLFESYEAVMEQIPKKEVEALHLALRDSGQVEVIDAEVTTTPEGYRHIHIPVDVQNENKPVLSMTHGLADGTVYRTWIEPSDLPSFEQDIRYANWLMKRIKGQ